MRTIFFLCTLVLVAGCKMVDAVDAVNETPQKMDNMNRELLKTSDAIRMQKLAIAKENLEDEKNGKILTPIPFGLMGYAKLFAESAKVDELVGQVYLYISDVHDGLPSQSVGADGVPLEFTAQQIAEINQYKNHRFTVVQAISSFVPDELLADMIDQEIIGAGRYRDIALNILMLRVQFNRKVLLENSLLGEDLKSVGALQKAYTYIHDIDKVFGLPFVAEIGYDMYGFLPPLKSEVRKLTPEYMKSTMVSIIEKTKLKAKNLKALKLSSVTGNEAMDFAKLQENQKRADQVFADLEAKLNFWKTK